MVAPAPRDMACLPPPGGHYSHAVQHGGLAWISGQLPLGPDGSRDPGLPFEAQAERALLNLGAVLAGLGLQWDSLLRLTVYLADIAHWPAMDAACARHLGPHRPARSIVPTGPLHFGFLVEIDAVAAAVAAAGRPP